MLSGVPLLHIICLSLKLKLGIRMVLQSECHVVSPLHLMPTAKEKAQQYKEAKEAYDKAGDMDNVVRLNVEHLNNLAEAHIIVRRTKSAEAAALVAKVCLRAARGIPGLWGRRSQGPRDECHLV